MLCIEEVLERYKFETDVEQVLRDAQGYAQQRQSREITPEHLLVSLTKYPETLGARILAEVDITEDNVERVLVRMHQRWDKLHPLKTPVFVYHGWKGTTPPHLSVTLHELINRAVDQLTNRWGERQPIGTANLLLELTQVKDDMVSLLLCDYDLTHMAVRRQLPTPEVRV